MGDVSREQEIRERVAKATKGPWFDAYCGIFSKPLVDEYNRLESALPEDASDSAYDELPSTFVAHLPAAYGDTPSPQGAADGAFISHAREDIPFLLEEVDRLRAVAHAAKIWAAVVGPVPDDGYHPAEEVALCRAVETADRARGEEVQG